MTALVVAALVLGIGLNAAVFSVVNAVLLRPLPLFEPDRIIRIYAKVNRTGATFGISYPEYSDWKVQSHSFDAVAVMRSVSFTLTGNGNPEHLKVSAISASGFGAWGVRVILGRQFSNADDQPGADRTVILNYAFWQRKFGGDPTVLGKSLSLDDESYTIIGILQPTQIGILQYPDVWVTNGPLLDERVMARDQRLFFPVARLKANVSESQARTEMETIAGRLTAQYPETNKDIGIRFISQTELLTSDGRKPLVLLIIASSVIFLLANVNVIAVFMASIAERRQELSMRLALGASRSSLFRQLFIQALIYAVASTVLGLMLCKIGLTFFLHYFPAALFRFQETTIDLKVLLFTICLTLASALAGTLAPAIYVSKLKINRELTGDQNCVASPRYRVFRQGALIFFEVMLASALTLISSLLIRSFYEVQKIDLGFNPHRILSFQINLPPARYKNTSQQSDFSKKALDKLANLPGIESVSGISSLPLTSQGEVNNLDVSGQSPLSGNRILVEAESVLPGFFRTMRIPLLQGRDFNDADHHSAPLVIIVDDVLATKLWPGQNPLGKQLRMNPRSGGTPHSLEIVGVVQEIKHFGPEAKVRWMQVYVPQFQDPSPTFSFVASTMIPESQIEAPAEKAIHELDKNLPVENVQTMDAYLDNFLSGRKVSLFLLSSYASIGVALGMIGIYGVVANTVVRRGREIAIRMAVGATVPQVITLVTRASLFAALLGILVGSVLAMSLTHVLASYLFGVSALSPIVYVASASIIIVLALAASIIPALRLFHFNIQQILRDDN